MPGTAFRALTIQSGVTTQIQPGYQLMVGNGIDSDLVGALTIGTALATSVDPVVLPQQTYQLLVFLHSKPVQVQYH